MKTGSTHEESVESSVEVRVEILRNAIRFLDAYYPEGEKLEKFRSQKLKQLRQLEAEIP